MRRRQFIAVTGAAAVWTFTARTQDRATVGILDPGVAENFAIFGEAMRALGYVEGKNLTYLYRSAEGEPGAISELASELVKLRPDVIVTTGPSAIRAVRDASTSVPIVFAVLSDPVAVGAVNSLAHPGGNVTGLSLPNDELGSKRLQLLVDAFPDIRRVGVLWDKSTSQAALASTKAAGKILNLDLQIQEIRGTDAFETAVGAIRSTQVDALDVLGSPFFYVHRQRLAVLSRTLRLPAIYVNRDYVRAGGLMSYGPSFPEMYKRAAELVAKILKGGAGWRLACRTADQI
jgi:putative ABC transport system substrate-binding protein